MCRRLGLPGGRHVFCAFRRRHLPGASRPALAHSVARPIDDTNPRGYQCYESSIVTGSPCTDDSQCTDGRACNADGENVNASYCSCIADSDCPFEAPTCVDPALTGVASARRAPAEGLRTFGEPMHSSSRPFHARLHAVFVATIACMAWAFSGCGSCGGGNLVEALYEDAQCGADQICHVPSVSAAV